MDIQRMYLVTEILDGFICYSGQYYGAVIEIPPVEFRFFSEHRQSNAIDRALGGVIRSVGPKYAANLVKLERPMVLDEYIDGEYDKIDALKKGYERGVFSEEELKARIEVIYDRINQLRQQNLMDKVLIPHFYLVLFDSDKRQLDNQMRSAITSLTQGEMVPHRLNDKELAVFLRYVNSADFDEREIEDTDPADYALFAMPESLELKHRTAEVNSVITHGQDYEAGRERAPGVERCAGQERNFCESSLENHESCSTVSTRGTGVRCRRDGVGCAGDQPIGC